MRGTTIVGHGYPDGGVWHALIWTDGGATITDIHPAGYFTSFLYAMNQTHQVGLATTLPDDNGNNNEHAMVWNGTAASAVDLHAFLIAVEPEYTDSVARGIDADGNIYGYANIGGTGYVAVRWTPVQTGACCIGVTCATTTSTACAGNAQAAGLNFAFVAAPGCNQPGNATTPCCRADYNKAGGVTVQDIFDFLAAYFNGSTAADFAGNGAGTPGVQSIFDFLAAYFQGGC